MEDGEIPQQSKVQELKTSPLDMISLTTEIERKDAGILLKS